MLTIVRGHLASDIPVVGVELNPYILVKKPDGSVSTEDFSESSYGHGSYLRYKWYRVQTEKEKYFCSVHPSILATLQCTCCTKMRVPLNKTFFCTPQCFKSNWHSHKVLHARAANTKEARELEEILEARIAGQGNNGNFDSSQLYRKPETIKWPNGEIWYTVGYNKFYTPSPDDIGFCLKLECFPVDSASDSTGGPYYLSTEKVIPAPTPIPRRMISLRPPTAYSDEKGMKLHGTFTVLSYNILAELYATHEMFSYCPSWALAWPYRRQNLLNEILGYDADVVCLQEVQSDHYEKFFMPEMDKNGYVSVFMKKTREMFVNNAYAIDGCATFYKRSRWTEVKRYELDFSKPGIAYTEDINAKIPEKERQRILKDNLAVVVVLEDKLKLDWVDSQEKGSMVCVANTHITSSPEYKDVKMWQVSLLARGLERVLNSIYCPIIIAGDFNSVPGSAAYVLATTGRIDPGHPEWATDPKNILTPGFLYGHRLGLRSAYSSSRSMTGPFGEKHKRRCDNFHYEPLFTNCNRDFIGTLDYIFYTTDTLNVEGLLEVLDESDIRKDTGLPSPEWPSDHIAIMAEFSYRPPQQQLRR